LIPTVRIGAGAWRKAASTRESGGTDQAKTTIHDVAYGHRNGKKTEKKLLMKEPRQEAREEQLAPDLIINPPLPPAIPLHSVTPLAATGYERKNPQEKHRPS
jgi:hypothetical protein